MVSKLQAEIPPEIMHKIINELKGDTYTLQQTSLVAHSFLHPSQQALISSITMNLYDSGDADADTRKLVSTLNGNPGLASHVRDLTLTISDVPTSEATGTFSGGESSFSGGESFSTLAMLIHLQQLSLHHIVNWARFDPAFKHTILNLCMLPNLSVLALADTRDFPFDHIIPYLLRLRKLTLTNVDLTQSKVEISLPENEMDSAVFQGRLEVVNFDCITARSGLAKLFTALIAPQSRLETLRALQIRGHGPYFEEGMSIEKIMGFVAGKLECFIWGTLDEASVLRLYSSWVSYQPRFDTGAINLAAMTNLRCLAVSFVLNVGSGSYTANTVWIMNSLEAMKENNCLEELIIILYPNQIRDTTPDMVGWPSRLDILPVQDGFRTLSKVSIYLAAPQSHQFPLGVEEAIVQQMPTSHASGILKVQRLHDWHDAQILYDSAITRYLSR